MWAVQDAIVIVEEAIVYSDVQMTSPVGYISKGKKIKIGEIPKNKAQVYPIVVSGKIAYIRVVDLSTEKADLKKENFVAERFQNQVKEEPIKTSFSVASYQYNSQILTKASNGSIQDKDPISWQGISLRGNGLAKERWEFQLLTNYMTSKQGDESFKVLETGLGGGYRFINWGRFYTRLETHLLLVPWASYALGSDFRVNGRGYTAGVGVSASLTLGDHFGVDGYFGSYYTTLSGFSVPQPFSALEPIFYGTRLGFGIHYAF